MRAPVERAVALHEHARELAAAGHLAAACRAARRAAGLFCAQLGPRSPDLAQLGTRHPGTLTCRRNTLSARGVEIVR